MTLVMVSTTADSDELSDLELDAGGWVDEEGAAVELEDPGLEDDGLEVGLVELDVTGGFTDVEEVVGGGFELVVGSAGVDVVFGGAAVLVVLSVFASSSFCLCWIPFTP